MTEQTIYRTTAKSLTPEAVASWRKLLQIFHNERDEPYGDLLTETQVQIIDIIAKRRHPRTQLILPTQYGKSLSVALGVLLRVTHYKEKWAIVAPSEDKARIIMDYIIEHIFDDPLFIDLLDYSGTKETLLKERSKTRLTFRGMGEVRVYTSNASNTQAVKKALMGFGAPNVILDESPLTPDELYATIKRMVGGTKNNFIFEIGNPFFRNHFYRTWTGERYENIFVDVYHALQEGRYTQDYIDEMREEAMFDVLYECRFPQANEMLPNGYRRLLNDDLVDNAFIDSMPQIEYKTDGAGNPLKNRWGFPIPNDRVIIGVDVAGTGSNETRIVARFPAHNFAIVAAVMDTEDLEEIADRLEDVAHRYDVGDYRIVIDAGGVGHGLPAIMRRRGYLVKGVLFGETSPDKTFLNLRAFMYWALRKSVRGGLRLVHDPGFNEAKLIYYKRTASDKTQIEPKEEMIKREAKEGKHVQSPDTADGLVLTFVDTSAIVEEDDVQFLGVEAPPDEDKYAGLVRPAAEDDDNIIDVDDDLDLM